MTDRVRMKSLTVLNNPLITVHADQRSDTHTVIEGDEFSTSEDHARELEAAKYAERVAGKAGDLTDEQKRLVGSQTPADGAIVTGRVSSGPQSPAEQKPNPGGSGAVAPGISEPRRAPKAPADA